MGASLEAQGRWAEAAEAMLRALTLLRADAARGAGGAGGATGTEGPEQQQALIAEYARRMDRLAGLERGRMSTAANMERILKQLAAKEAAAARAGGKGKAAR